MYNKRIQHNIKSALLFNDGLDFCQINWKVLYKSIFRAIYTKKKMRRNFTVEQHHQMITWRYFGPSKEGIVELHLLCWRWYSLTPRWLWSRHLGDSRKVWCSESSRAGESSFLCNCIGSSEWWWRAKHRPLNKRTWQLPPKSTVPPSRWWCSDVVFKFNVIPKLPWRTNSLWCKRVEGRINNAGALLPSLASI